MKLRRQKNESQFHKNVGLRSNKDNSLLQALLVEKCLKMMKDKREALISDRRGIVPPLRSSDYYQEIKEIVSAQLAGGTQQIDQAVSEENNYLRLVENDVEKENPQQDQEDAFMEFGAKDTQVTEEEFEEIMLSIMVEIDKETKERDASSFLNEIRYLEHFESTCIEHLIEDYTQSSHSDAVPCPLCKISNLHQSFSPHHGLGAIVCQGCSFYINANAEGLTLHHLKEQLANSFNDHQVFSHGQCSKNVQFLLDSVFGIDSLSCHCTFCGYYEIVI